MNALLKDINDMRYLDAPDAVDITDDDREEAIEYLRKHDTALLMETVTESSWLLEYAEFLMDKHPTFRAEFERVNANAIDERAGKTAGSRVNSEGW